jgi:hypothetical protein
MKWLPTPGAVAREAAVVILGAVAAAFLIGLFPGLRQWIRDQWTGTGQ